MYSYRRGWIRKTKTEEFKYPRFYRTVSPQMIQNCHWTRTPNFGRTSTSNSLRRRTEECAEMEVNKRVKKDETLKLWPHIILNDMI